MSLSGKLKGHKASVCCLKAQPGGQVLASGAEDGAVCRFDLRTNVLISRIQVAGKDEAVPSIAWHPKDTHLLYHCSGTTVSCVDTRKEDATGEGPQHFNFNGDEINCVDLNASGTLLAAADDLGQVAIVDLTAGSLIRTLKPGHGNIASSVVFSGGGSGWEVVSAGLDCQMIKWSVSGGNPLKRWKMDAGDNPQATQVCNPPMIHGLATPSPSGDLAGFAAVARGDGAVAVYDLDPGAKQGRRGSRGSATTPPTAPVFSSQCHSAAANCISFPEAGAGKLLLSGGNDGRVLLQSWAGGLSLKNGKVSQEDGTDGGRGGWCIEHGQKVNDVAVPGALDRVYIAGVSKLVSVYSIC